MKSAPLPKGQSQLEVKATLRHRGQVNDCVSVTFDVEPSAEAKERYVGWVAMILDNHSTRARILENNEAGVWKTKYKATERALRELVARCDGDEGVRADGSNIDTSAAHSVLDRNENGGAERLPVEGGTTT